MKHEVDSSDGTVVAPVGAALYGAVGSERSKYLGSVGGHPRRKIIQIASSTESHLYALCDDGTLWLKDGGTWSPVSGEPGSAGYPGEYNYNGP